MENIKTLTEFLDYFDFDYVVYSNGLLGLIDEQGADLGDITSERYENNEQGVLCIVDRLDMYYEDYIFNILEEVLEEEHNIDVSSMKWTDLYNKVKDLNLDYFMDILPYIFGDKTLILDSDKKEVSEEYLLEWL